MGKIRKGDNMKFEMNDRIFTIKLVSENELWGDIAEKNNKSANYFGRFRAYDQEIWLSQDLSKEQMKKTLIHELMHCYLWCYSTPFDSYSEEDVCNISSNSHIIISEIINKYFGGKDER